MQKKVSKIVLFAIFCSVFSNIFSASDISRALDLARNIQSSGSSVQDYLTAAEIQDIGYEAYKIKSQGKKLTQLFLWGADANNKAVVNLNFLNNVKFTGSSNPGLTDLNNALATYGSLLMNLECVFNQGVYTLTINTYTSTGTSLPDLSASIPTGSATRIAYAYMRYQFDGDSGQSNIPSQDKDFDENQLQNIWLSISTGTAQNVDYVPEEYDLKGSSLQELNIAIGTAGNNLTFVQLPPQWETTGQQLLDDLSFIPAGTTEFTLVLYGYSLGNETDYFQDKADLITAYNSSMLGGFDVLVYGQDGRTLLKTIPVPSEMKELLAQAIIAKPINLFLGINSQGVNPSPLVNYPVTLTVKNIGNWNPVVSGIATSELATINLKDFKSKLGITVPDTVLQSAHINNDGTMPWFNINFPLQNVHTGYAFVENPWGSNLAPAGTQQTADQGNINKTQWNVLAQVLKNGGYMSMTAADDFRIYIADPSKKQPRFMHLHFFDASGNQITNLAGAPGLPIEILSSFYTGNKLGGSLPTFNPVNSNNPIEVGGLNQPSGIFATISTYPCVISFGLPGSATPTTPTTLTTPTTPTTQASVTSSSPVSNALDLARNINISTASNLTPPSGNTTNQNQSNAWGGSQPGGEGFFRPI